MKIGRTFLFLFLFFLSINNEWYLIVNKETSWINFLINKKTSKKKRILPHPLLNLVCPLNTKRLRINL